jgi:transcriptional regulator with XRE-family HTH domain
MTGFDLAGALRRIRRRADLSQRELAQACGVAHSVVAQAESGRRGLQSDVFARAAALAGLRLALVDADGYECRPMSPGAVRDQGYRRFPAHLDTRYSDESWWHGPHRYDRVQPWFTFDRDRRSRDASRGTRGTPDDHHVPQPGDAPEERAEARRRAYRRQQAEERERRFLAGEFSRIELGFVCDCPPGCDELDIGERPVHVPACPCSCDLG